MRRTEMLHYDALSHSARASELDDAPMTFGSRLGKDGRVRQDKSRAVQEHVTQASQAAYVEEEERAIWAVPRVDDDAKNKLERSGKLLGATN